jgi:hypothetical protein
VGLSTVKAIVANKIAPGLLDRYLGRTGYDSQQGEDPLPPDRPANLWQPVPGLHRAHGSFDEQAKPYSGTLWLDTHRGWVLAAGAAAVALLLGGRRRR